MSETPDTVVRGDKIRISVALLRQLYDQPDHMSELVEVGEVRSEPDGSKMLVLNRVSS